MSEPVWNPMAQQYEPKPALTLAEFLLARIAEDEWTANDAGGPTAQWWWQSCASLGRGKPGEVELQDEDSRQPIEREPWGIVAYGGRPHHITVHDPARVLAECQAKRRIVARHERCGSMVGYCDDGGHSDWPQMGCPDLEDLALPYADHPDYDEAWKP